VFWPLQSNFEVSGVSEDSQVPISRVWVSSSHSSKSGVATNDNTSRQHFEQIHVCGETKAPLKWQRKKRKPTPIPTSKKPKHVSQAQKRDVLDKWHRYIKTLWEICNMLSTYLQITWVTLYLMINLLYALRFNMSLFLSLDFVPYDNHSFTKHMD
jgi:hypothetical protein